MLHGRYWILPDGRRELVCRADAAKQESHEEWASRVPLLLPYRVTEQLMSASGKAATMFLHCLPSVHNADTELGRRLLAQFGIVGAEVSDDVFESERSLVFDQAENRMHTIKAVMVTAFGG